MHDTNANDDVDEAIRRSTQREIPAAVEERLRHRLTEFRGRLEQRPPNRMWVRAMAMAATLVAAVAAGLVLLPREYGASRVYAAAAREPGARGRRIRRREQAGGGHGAPPPTSAGCVDRPGDGIRTSRG
jgi:hypothetical protein